MDLEFGRCKLQVQVPDKGPITRPEQLVGKNIVTSFTNLSEKYFAGLEQAATAAEADGAAPNGDAPKPSKTSIKYVGGSVEAACALGVADGIVDLVGMLTQTRNGLSAKTNTYHRVRRNHACSRPKSHLHSR